MKKKISPSVYPDHGYDFKHYIKAILRTLLCITKQNDWNNVVTSDGDSHW